MRYGLPGVFDRASWQRKARVQRRFRRAEKAKETNLPGPTETPAVEGG